MFSKSNIILLLIVALMVLYFVNSEFYKPRNSSIGGDFTLINHLGEQVTNESYNGKARLVYFGYSYCPDICPTGLSAMQETIEQMRGEAPVGLFITVDPQRDTQEDLALYMQNFPNIIGLVGSPEQTKQVADAYGVHYNKVDNKESPEDYVMDHNSFIYLMDKYGNYLLHFQHGVNPKEMVARIRQALYNYDK